jgi:hypothetical protein
VGALNKLAALTSHARLVPAHSAELNTALRKVIDKDANLFAVVAALGCVRNMARGQGERFGQTALFMLPSILAKFKEKKSNAVAAVQEAADACVASVCLQFAIRAF